MPSSWPLRFQWRCARSSAVRLVEAEPGVKFPLSVAVLSGFCTGAGVALIFAAGAAARGAWRYVAIVPLATVTAAAAAYPFGNAVPESLRPLWWVPLVFLAAAAAVLIAGQRIRIRWTLFLSLAICLLFVSVMAGISMALAPTFAPTLLFLFLGFSAIALGPALVVLGFDFSEIVTVFSGAALSWVGPRKYVAPAVRWLLPTICVTGTAAYLAEVARLQDALKIAVLAFALAFVFAAIVLSLRSKEGAPQHEGPLSYHSVLLISVMLLGGLFPVDAIFSAPDSHYFSFTKGHHFSFVLAEGWTPVIPSESILADEESPYSDVRRSFVPSPRNGAVFTIAAILREPQRAGAPSPERLNQIIPVQALDVPIAPDTDAGEGWRQGEARYVGSKGTPYTLEYWVREDATPTAGTNVTWYQFCSAPDAILEQTLKQCERMRESFRASPRSVTAPLALIAFGPLLWSAIAFAAWWIGRVRRSAKRSTLLVDVLMWTAIVHSLKILWGLWLSHGYLKDLFAAFTDTGLSVGMLIASIWVASGAIIGGELWALRAPSKVAGAVRTAGVNAALALLLITGCFWLYTFLADRSEASHVIRGVVVCVGLSWELFISGPTLNAQATPAFPISSRAFLFMGYLILVATAVFMFPAIEIWGSMEMEAFDPEALVAAGIVAFGVALVFAEAMRRVGAEGAFAAAEPKADT
jgi:hypothetical protein